MKASQFRALIKEEVKKALKESAMSDIDLMAQDAISFNAFAVEFFKEYPNIQKDEKMGFIKWLKTIYKNAKENK
jgi:ATP-dependent Clp protease adapter protein ClpS